MHQYLDSGVTMRTCKVPTCPGFGQHYLNVPVGEGVVKMCPAVIDSLMGDEFVYGRVS